MAFMIAPCTGRDDVLKGVKTAIGLGSEVFSRTAKVLGQPNRYAKFFGELFPALLPHPTLAIEAQAVLVRECLSTELLALCQAHRVSLINQANPR